MEINFLNKFFSFREIDRILCVRNNFAFLRLSRTQTERGNAIPTQYFVFIENMLFFHKSKRLSDFNVLLCPVCLSQGFSIVSMYQNIYIYR